MRKSLNMRDYGECIERRENVEDRDERIVEHQKRIQSERHLWSSEDGDTWKESKQGWNLSKKNPNRPIGGGIGRAAIAVVNEDGVHYNSVSAAARSIDVTPAEMSNAINHKYRCRGKYWFREQGV